MPASDGVVRKLIDIINFSLHSPIDYTSYVEKGNYAHPFGNIIELTYTHRFNNFAPFDAKKFREVVIIGRYCVTGQWV
jgi:hypothetical protein